MLRMLHNSRKRTLSLVLTLLFLLSCLTVFSPTYAKGKEVITISEGGTDYGVPNPDIPIEIPYDGQPVEFAVYNGKSPIDASYIFSKKGNESSQQETPPKDVGTYELLIDGYDPIIFSIVPAASRNVKEEPTDYLLIAKTMPALILYTGEPVIPPTEPADNPTAPAAPADPVAPYIIEPTSPFALPLKSGKELLVTVTSGGIVAANYSDKGSIKLTFDPAEGCLLTNVTLDGKSIGAVDELEVESDGEEHDVKAEFANAKEYVVNVFTLNIRSGPGTTYGKLGQLNRNSVISALPYGNTGWFKVLFDDGSVGYVSGKYISEK